VRTLREGWADAGRHELIWDGTDERGRPVGSGVYLFRLEAAGTASVRSVVLVR
jgi:flagellar hook assembly protein FlgD